MFVWSILFTAIHVIEELVGPGGPLWRNFGKIVGLRLPDKLGFGLFTVGLTALLVGVSAGAYVYESGFWLSVLFGARVGDAAISHWFLRWRRLSVPNPGIYSTVLYAIEAALIVRASAAADEYLHALGMLVGAGFFAAVLPSLWLLRRIVPSWSA